MNDQTIDAIRNDLLNDEYGHCAECHDVTKISDGFILEGSLYCRPCYEAEFKSDMEFVAEFDNNPGYCCSNCGKPVTSSEADDNGGKCDDCAWNEFDVAEFPSA